MASKKTATMTTACRHWGKPENDLNRPKAGDIKPRPSEYAAGMCNRGVRLGSCEHTTAVSGQYCSSEGTVFLHAVGN